MLTTQRGSPDGCEVRSYVQGIEYDLSHTPRERELAEVFVREGWAEDASARREEKDLGPAPENKDCGPAPENKRRRVCKTEGCGRSALTDDGLCERCSDPDWTPRAAPRRKGRG